MANARWKQFEKSDGFKKAKLFAKRLIGKELRIRPDVQLATVENSDWLFYDQPLFSGAIVYSLGVGEETEFDEELMANYGAIVHAFDPTPNTLSWVARQELPAAFHFHPWAVTANDGVLTLYPRRKSDGSVSSEMLTMVPDAGMESEAIEVPAYSLQSIVKMLDHSHIDLLKMDIEGAEYEVLDGLIGSDIRPTQLLVEFHHRFASIGKEKTAATIRRLRDIGYRLYAVSINGREVSFIQESYLAKNLARE